jgi:hypothetical protein
MRLLPPYAFFIVVLLAVTLCTLICHFRRIRSATAKKLYLSQCDVALQYPQLANPEGQLDVQAKTVGGDKTAFEQYEWYVARLVYVLDECMLLSKKPRWRAVADTQLGVHKRYFGSDYYKKQNYLPHYSEKMRQLIEQQGKSA